MSTKEFVIAFDCGGIFANDIPVDMFKQLAQEKYPESERARVADIHARKYVCSLVFVPSSLLFNLLTPSSSPFRVSKDLWGRFKLETGFTETMYFQSVIEREKLNESIDELKRRLRESIVCYQHVREVAVSLRKMGYDLAIMSNHSTEWFDYISSTFNFPEFCPINRTIVSQTVNAAKPSMEIMEKLFQSIVADFPGHDKSKVVFIDDTEANIIAAQKYGFEGFVYDAREQTAEDLWSALSKYGVHRQ